MLTKRIKLSIVVLTAFFSLDIFKVNSLDINHLNARELIATTYAKVAKWGPWQSVNCSHNATYDSIKEERGANSDQFAKRLANKTSQLKDQLQPKDETIVNFAKLHEDNIPVNLHEREEGRSNNGQSFYSQWSNVNLTNFNQENRPVYKHAVNKQPGFQDRFNPPPYFSVVDKDAKKLTQATNTDPKAVIYPQNSYDSGVSSYDPNPSGIPDILSQINSNQQKFPGPSNSSSPGNYQENDQNHIRGPTYPPYQPLKTNNEHEHKHEHHYEDDLFAKPHFPSYLYIKNSSDYIKPSMTIDHVLKDHNGNEDHNYSIEYDDKTIDDLPEYIEHDADHHVHDHGHHDHDHHVKGKYTYHLPESYQYDYPVRMPVVKPVTMPTSTTMEMMPEDERVNKGHYSYYYLGRKLWYIPLYFSVYFIVYITVLILKSIARHKVTFAHDLTNINKERSFNDNVDQVYESTTRAIKTFRKRYYAM